MATDAKRLWNRCPVQRPRGIDEIGVTAMCFTHRTAEPIGLPRIHDQVRKLTTNQNRGK
jgi:hypothetical protein